MLHVHNISESNRRGLKRKHDVRDLQMEDDSASGREDRVDSTRESGGRADIARGRVDATRGRGGRVDATRRR